MQAILDGNYSFTPLEYWRGVSLQARAFIKRCLTVDPVTRMTAHEALCHPWVSGDNGNGENLLPNVKKNFNARRALHKAIDTVRAINQLRAGHLSMMDGATSKEPERHSNGNGTGQPKDREGDSKMGGTNGSGKTLWTPKDNSTVAGARQ